MQSKALLDGIDKAVVDKPTLKCTRLHDFVVASTFPRCRKFLVGSLFEQILLTTGCHLFVVGIEAAGLSL